MIFLNGVLILIFSIFLVPLINSSCVSIPVKFTFNSHQNKILFSNSAFNVFSRYLIWTKSILSDIRNNVKSSGSFFKVALNRNASMNDDGYILISGSCGDIGNSLSHKLASFSFPLILTARQLKQSALEEKCSELRNRYAIPCEYFILNMNDLSKDVYAITLNHVSRILSRRHSPPLYAIVHNAGVMSGVSIKEIFHVNVLAPLALTLLLSPLLATSPCVHPVILQISSSAHLREPPYCAGQLKNHLRLPSADEISKPDKALRAYGESKLMLMLIGQALRSRFHDSGILILDAHPGLVDTQMLRKFFRFPIPFSDKFMRSPTLSADYLVNALLTPSSVTAAEKHKMLLKPYFVDGVWQPQRASENAYNIEASEHCYSDALDALPAGVRVSIVDNIQRTLKTSCKNGTPIREYRRLALLAIESDVRKSLLRSSDR